jgi:glutathione synthase/RimK-type ligase-like ATP-grasp enzyme
MPQGSRITLVKPDSPTHRHNARGVYLNWGNSKFPTWWDYSIPHTTINSFKYIQSASNKLAFFNQITDRSDEGSHLPPYTVSLDEAAGWIVEGHTVVARTILTGHSGNGIVLASTVSELPAAPLYVKYIKKQSEWRVHVFNDEVIDVQKKMVRAGSTDNNFQVRNVEGGWIYGRQFTYGVGDFEERLKAVVLETASKLPLDFGAYDVIYNARQDKFYVLEVNTAPGLTGTTVSKYSEAICQHLEGL